MRKRGKRRLKVYRYPSQCVLLGRMGLQGVQKSMRDFPCRHKHLSSAREATRACYTVYRDIESTPGGLVPGGGIKKDRDFSCFIEIWHSFFDPVWLHSIMMYFIEMIWSLLYR